MSDGEKNEDEEQSNPDSDPVHSKDDMAINVEDILHSAHLNTIMNYKESVEAVLQTLHLEEPDPEKTAYAFCLENLQNEPLVKCFEDLKGKSGFSKHILKMIKSMTNDTQKYSAILKDLEVQLCVLPNDPGQFGAYCITLRDYGWLTKKHDMSDNMVNFLLQALDLEFKEYCRSRGQIQDTLLLNTDFVQKLKAWKLTSSSPSSLQTLGLKDMTELRKLWTSDGASIVLLPEVASGHFYLHVACLDQ